MILRCTPRGLCSWNFDLVAAAAQSPRAGTTIDWLSEQGSVTADGVAFEVQKHGPLSGHWTLHHRDSVQGEARKSSAFTRTFELASPMGELVLAADSMLTRAFHLRDGDEDVAALAPDHAFTRRATLEVHRDEFDLPTIAFALWLAVLTWRRAANDST